MNRWIVMTYFYKNTRQIQKKVKKFIYNTTEELATGFIVAGSCAG